MASGLEMMMNAVLKSINLDPEQIKLQLAQWLQIMADRGKQLDRVEANQILILSLLRKAFPDQAETLLQIEAHNGQQRQTDPGGGHGGISTATGQPNGSGVGSPSQKS